MEIKKEIKRDSYSVKITLEEDNKILGWAYLYIIFQDRHPEPYGLLENVYIESEYRSRGLGKQLVKLLIDEAKERGCYKLIATSKNNKPEVHSFYEKFGFKNIGVEFRIDLKESQILTKD